MDSASTPLLASARRSKGISVEFAARKLLLSTAQVRALEQGDSRAFYNQWFYQQALRKYAKYLDVPVPVGEPLPDPLSLSREAPGGDAGRPGGRARVLGATDGLAAMAAVVVMVAVMVGTREDSSRDRPLQPPPAPDGPATVRPATSPVPAIADATVAPSSAPEPGPQGVQSYGCVLVEEDAWIFVRYAEGAPVEERAIRGVPYRLTASPVYLAVGTTSVQLRLRGRPVDVSPWFVNGLLRMGKTALSRLEFTPPAESC